MGSQLRMLLGTIDSTSRGCAWPRKRSRRKQIKKELTHPTMFMETRTHYFMRLGSTPDQGAAAMADHVPVHGLFETH
jgi:hypothetical protein